MEIILYRTTDLGKVEALANIPNRALVIGTIQALFTALENPTDVLRLMMKEDGKTFIYSPYAVCIIEGDNTVLLEKEEVRGLYLTLYSKK